MVVDNPVNVKCEFCDSCFLFPDPWQLKYRVPHVSILKRGKNHRKPKLHSDKSTLYH